ncbi:MAG: hypothetical protein RLZ26_2514 [Pseudomonadota bacterium]|jgi:hypothetical protein
MTVASRRFVERLPVLFLALAAPFTGLLGWIMAEEGRELSMALFVAGVVIVWGRAFATCEAEAHVAAPLPLRRLRAGLVFGLGWFVVAAAPDPGGQVEIALRLGGALLLGWGLGWWIERQRAAAPAPEGPAPHLWASPLWRQVWVALPFVLLVMALGVVARWDLWRDPLHGLGAMAIILALIPGQVEGAAALALRGAGLVLILAALVLAA